SGMHLAPPADQRDETGHFTALDIAGHDIVHAAEPRPGQSTGAHRLFPPFRLIGMVLLVSGSTCLAPFGPQMLPSRVPMSDTMTFLMFFFSSFRLAYLTAIHSSSSTDNRLPAGSLNHAIFGPPPWKIPFSSVTRSPSW